MSDVINRIFDLPTGTVIPKPKAKGEFKIKGLGLRDGEKALVYEIPSHTHPKRPYQKGVTESELEKAFNQLSRTGYLTKDWFNANLQRAAKEGPCNFTTTGGLFQILGKAKYSRPGVYTRVSDSKSASESPTG